MSCILKISGELLDIDTLLSHHTLVADRVWKTGGPRTLKGQLNTDSGVSFIVSEAGLNEFGHQVTDAVEFLATHAPAIAAMAGFPGAQHAAIDFGIALTPDKLAQYLYLPANLIQLVATAGIGIEISHYACSEDDEND